MNRIKKLLASTAFLGAAIATPAQSAEVIGGVTKVTLDAAPVLADAGISATTIGSASVVFDGNIPTFTFPITGGTTGESCTLLEHDGSGISFFTADSTLNIRNFLVDTAALTVFGSVGFGDPEDDDDDIDNVALFSIGEGLTLALTEQSAGAFDEVFGVELAVGTVVGSANPMPETAAAVPEPSTWALMLFGFTAVGGAMRAGKRRQNATVTYA